MLKYLLASALLLCGIGPLTAQESMSLGRENRIDSVLASVNGEPVTLLDVMLESGHDEGRLAAMFTGERLYSETEKLRRKIVDEIVVRKLIFNEYKANPFEIKKQHIEDVVDSIAQTMGDGTRAGLERKLKSYGATMREIRDKALEKIAVDVLMMDHCDRRVFITPRQVYEHYRSNARLWTRPDKPPASSGAQRHRQRHRRNREGSFRHAEKRGRQYVFPDHEREHRRAERLAGRLHRLHRTG